MVDRLSLSAFHQRDRALRLAHQGIVCLRAHPPGDPLCHPASLPNASTDGDLYPPRCGRHSGAACALADPDRRNLGPPILPYRYSALSVVCRCGVALFPMAEGYTPSGSRRARVTYLILRRILLLRRTRHRGRPCRSKHDRVDYRRPGLEPCDIQCASVPDMVEWWGWAGAVDS